LRLLAKATAKDPSNGVTSCNHPISSAEAEETAKFKPCLFSLSDGGPRTKNVNWHGMHKTTRKTSSLRIDFRREKRFANPIPTGKTGLIEPSARRRLRIPSHDTVFTFQRSAAQPTTQPSGAKLPLPIPVKETRPAHVSSCDETRDEKQRRLSAPPLAV